MRRFRNTAYGAILVALLLVLGACGSGVGDDEDSGSSGSETGGGGEPVAAQMTLGGPPECPERPFCIPGLKETYGVEFANFQPLDIGGPLTVKALSNGRIDVGLLFSTSSAIVANDFVLLEDDKGLQTAENITPLLTQDLFDPVIEQNLNKVSEALDTETMTELNGRVELDQEDPADVAADFIAEAGIEAEQQGNADPITIGAVAFAENQIVAEMYAEVLRSAGYEVETKTDLRSREVLYPALKSGEIDLAPEYVGSLLLFLDPEAAAGGDPQGNIDLLTPLVEKDGLALLQPSAANDTNAFVVTRETADEFGLSTVSDLASPAE
jgi:glycine betaine/choline ABC-type transport system substrate-binding protein